jgi:D-hexose-6-phosphate mutarotase
MAQISLEQARAAKSAAMDHFREIGNVTGVGVTRVDGDYAVKVNLSEQVRPGVKIPEEIDGVPVRVEVTGSIRPR